jgi:hypothetical protein
LDKLLEVCVRVRDILINWPFELSNNSCRNI